MVAAHHRTICRSFANSEFQAFGGQHRAGIVAPERGIGIDVQLDFNAIRIMNVERLAHAVVAHAENANAARFQLGFTGTQLVQTIAHLEGNMIQPDRAGISRG